jgi:hypothetical protein
LIETSISYSGCSRLKPTERVPPAKPKVTLPHTDAAPWFWYGPAALLKVLMSTRLPAQTPELNTVP